mmetsp:Transcript_4783/g.11512  ORF Transcript_4783/g.11512 Transcript_4783/m.11512 type:complete len:249 (-) Transcript_4783:287-1033(-)
MSKSSECESWAAKTRACMSMVSSTKSMTDSDGSTAMYASGRRISHTRQLRAPASSCGPMSYSLSADSSTVPSHSELSALMEATILPISVTWNWSLTMPKSPRHRAQAMNCVHDPAAPCSSGGIMSPPFFSRFERRAAGGGAAMSLAARMRGLRSGRAKRGCARRAPSTNSRRSSCAITSGGVGGGGTWITLAARAADTSSPSTCSDASEPLLRPLRSQVLRSGREARREVGVRGLPLASVRSVNATVG